MNIALYHFEGCPYCGRVRKYMAEHNIVIPLKDIHTSSLYRDELVEIGGKKQVPCLVIDGKALYESLDIIEWFKKYWRK